MWILILQYWHHITVYQISANISLSFLAHSKAIAARHTIQFFIVNVSIYIRKYIWIRYHPLRNKNIISKNYEMRSNMDIKIENSKLKDKTIKKKKD